MVSAVAQGKKKTSHILDHPPIAVLSASQRFHNSPSRNSFHPLNAWISARNYLTPLLAAVHGILICLGTLTTTLPYDVHAESAVTPANAIHTFNILPNPLEE